MTPQPINEGGSEARFRECFKQYEGFELNERDERCRAYKYFWLYQEAYWSKRCEAMEEALKMIADGECIDSCSWCCNCSNRIAREALSALQEKGDKSND